MAKESQAHLHTLLVTPESESTSISETSLSGDEDTIFLEELEKSDGEPRAEDGDIENGINGPPRLQKKKTNSLQFVGWTIINTFATIGIVFTNKALFEDPSLRLNQSTFAAFHFLVTSATLYAVSRPSIGVFTPSRARFFDMMPLASAMCMNVILPNFSLAFSTVAFYQIVRVLLTPLVAGINFIVYETKIPRRAVWTLFPICIGVGVVSYYDTKAVAGEYVKTTSMVGVVFAFAGVVASSLYTVWIGTYQKKFEMSSMQLLFNQAPISAFLLLYVIPFTDQPPVWSQVPMWKWKLIAMSGIMASLINISQFYIVAGAGAVSSTVVGHVKTCSIVALGWATSGRKANDRSVFGILLAMSGVFAPKPPATQSSCISTESRQEGRDRERKGIMRTLFTGQIMKFSQTSSPNRNWLNFGILGCVGPVVSTGEEE